jgi:phage shock protein A
MAEPILHRVRRILNARLEDAVDRMERSGRDSVMLEAIREVDRAIDQVQADFEATMARRSQAVRQQKALREKLSELTGKAKFALAEGREDLAEAALSRQVDFEEQAGKLDAIQSQAGADETKFSENLVALRTRKQQMEEALAAFVASRRDVAPGGDEPATKQRGVERRVDQAEQAFGRAMSSAGGAGFTRADPETINRVAEIDVMQRRSIVAARLEALKQDGGTA